MSRIASESTASASLATGGDQKPLPETLTINLTPNAAWSIGTEIDLPSLKDDELALEIEPGDSPCDNIEDDNDVARSQPKQDDEKGASSRTKPGTNITKIKNPESNETNAEQIIVQSSHEVIGRNETMDTVIDSIMPEREIIHEYQDDGIFYEQIGTYEEDNREKEISHNVRGFVNTNDIFSRLVTKKDEIKKNLRLT